MEEHKRHEADGTAFAGPTRSRALLRLFGWYVRRYVRRHFSAVLLSACRDLPDAEEGPIVVYLNHPSWWDPLICMVVAMTLFPERAHYAPIDQAQLKRYRFFSKLGFFGVEPDSVRGALSFLRVGRAILNQPAAALWITPQGRIADPRERPVCLRQGLGRLVRGFGRCSLLPLAVEYPLNHERLPFAVVRFGRPTLAASLPSSSPSQCTEFLARQLEETQDALAEEVCSGDYSQLEVVLRGRLGVGFVYDLWRRVRVLISREQFHLGHGRDLR